MPLLDTEMAAAEKQPKVESLVPAEQQVKAETSVAG